MLSRKKEMKEAIQLDYPNMPEQFIDLFLDVYEKDPDFIQERIKHEKKIHKKVPDPKVQLTLEELDKLTEKFNKENPEGKAWVVAHLKENPDAIVKEEEDAVHDSQPELPSDRQDVLPQD